MFDSKVSVFTSDAKLLTLITIGLADGLAMWAE